MKTFNEIVSLLFSYFNENITNFSNHVIEIFSEMNKYKDKSPLEVPRATKKIQTEVT